MKVGLDPGHNALDGGTSRPPHKKGAQSPPILGPCLLWRKGWMYHDATWYGGRPGTTQGHCVRWGPRCPPKNKGQSSVPIFGPCLMWPDGWMHQVTTWYGGRPRPRRHCFRPRWGPSSLIKGHRNPIFSAHVYCGHGRPS